MFVACVEFEIDLDHLSAFMIAVRANAEQSLSLESGCKQFDICQDRKSSNSILLYEVYDDEAAFETHKLAPHYDAFNKAIDGMIVHKSTRFLNLDSQIR